MGQAFWTGVRLPSSPPASDRIAAMRFFFLLSMGRTNGEGDLDRKEEARSKGVFYIRRSQGKTRTDEGRGRSGGWVRPDLRIWHPFLY